MDIIISISKATEEAIKDKADANGQATEDFLSNFVESSFPKRSNGQDAEAKRRHNNLMRMAGMFSSGVSDTSERMREIMDSDNLDPAQGFGTSK